MSSPTIDFHKIRTQHGSQHAGFEELICQLANLESPPNVTVHRKGAGADGGLECFRCKADGSEIGWQAKYFFELGSSEASQLTKSFNKAIEKHPRLENFIVCLPFNLSDGRIEGRISQRDRWNKWVKARAKAILPRIVTIELWDETQLIERLSRSDPLYAGRLHYWFDTLHFYSDWFRSRFQITKEALGKRYTPELNIELPIRHGLLAIARDPEFIESLRRLADKIDEVRHSAAHSIIEPLGADTFSALDGQLRSICMAIRVHPMEPTEPIPFETWEQDLKQARMDVAEWAKTIWKLREEKSGDQDKYRQTYYFIDQLRTALDAALRTLCRPEYRLANSNHLLVDGAAGVGKSHLLADVADRHIAQGFPAILLLGGSFVDSDPWRQIADQLGLGSQTPDEILGALDAAGESVGTRGLIIVDAINERGGIAIWSSRLASFLATSKRFRHVAVVVSCRTTFLPFIVREIDETALPSLTHPGFAGRSAEAARRYLDHRGIVRMAAPSFSPEFENPLFLRTCCDALERRGETELPRGLDGVSDVFNFYFDAVTEAITIRMGLFARLKIVERAIAAITQAMIEALSGYLPLEKVNSVLEIIQPSQNLMEKNLFAQLEHEGILTVEPVVDGANTVEMVRFTFERLSDHRIAQALLKAEIIDHNPTTAFSEGGSLRAYVFGRDSSRFAGIAEAFAVQLPELFQIELIDLIGDDFAKYQLAPAFQESLLWRRQDAFSDRTLELVDTLSGYLEGDLWLNTIIAVATEPKNKFNADYLDSWLRPLSLPERDEKWSIRALFLGENDSSAIDTLIQWVLINGLNPIDPERARLTALTLAWLTSLTDRRVRDMATKALTILLVKRRALAAELIGRFANLNDAYVAERVLAAAYGAATRSQSDAGLAELSQAAYSAVFAVEPMPVHALVRDHARGIIELAAYRGVLPIGLEIDRARPPYPKGEPIEEITEADLNGFVQDYGGTPFHDDIMGSAVEDGDFARYVVDPLSNNFLELPREEIGRSMKTRYEDWYARNVADVPERIAALRSVLDLSECLSSMPYDFSVFSFETGEKLGGEIDEVGEPDRKTIEKERDEASAALHALFNNVELREYEIYAKEWVENVAWNAKASQRHPHFDQQKSRHWVAWRAHDLGWTPERFAELERHMESGGRMDHKVERVGKKYQWIALHELTGRLSDISAVDGGGMIGEPQSYSGPWQVGTREMDPTILVTRTEQRSSSKQPATWWSPHAPRWRDDPPQARIAWMRDKNIDVPDPAKQFEVVDPDGQSWLVLELSATRNQSVIDEGEQKLLRTSWHKFHSLLVPQGSTDRLLRRFGGSAHNRDHLHDIEIPWRAYLGEYIWHPAYADLFDSTELASPIREVYRTTTDRYVERSGQNYSIEESFNLTIPSPKLMRDLNLRLAEGFSLTYCDNSGRVLFKDPSTTASGHSAAVVDRNAFCAFLEREKLDLVWVFSGEKSATGGSTRGNGWGGDLGYSGQFRFDGKAVSGNLKFKHRKPSTTKLEEFLSHR